MKPRLKVDFHCHSVYSPDSLSSLRDLEKWGRKAGLDRLVITDHNTIRGALEAVRLNPEFFIAGEEIKTTRGELLAVYVKEEVPKNLTPQEAIRRLKKQSAFISVSHPYDEFRGWECSELEEMAGEIDAVEVWNSRCFTVEMNNKAGQFAREFHLGGTVGSDAHTLPEVGSSCLELPEFNDADSLRAVIKSGVPHTKLSSPAVRMGSRFAVVVKAISGRKPRD
ncbi:MAG: PHP-associated domain-containing protein [Anaerolineaceae bacterium]